METPVSNVQSLLESAEAYTKTSIEIAKLKAIESGTKVTVTLISKGSAVVMAAFFVLFLNIGLALWIGEQLGKLYYGFFIVAGFYLIAGIIFSAFMDKWIRKPISELIIREILQ